MHGKLAAPAVGDQRAAAGRVGRQREALAAAPGMPVGTCLNLLLRPARQRHQHSSGKSNVQAWRRAPGRSMAICGLIPGAMGRDREGPGLGGR